MIRQVFVDRDWDTMIATVTFVKIGKTRSKRVYRVHNDEPSAKRLSLLLHKCDRVYDLKDYEYGKSCKKCME